MAEEAADAPKPKRRNWWKIAFFVALFAFEVAREWAVIASAQEARLVASKSVHSFGGLVSAQGMWTRLDGGDRLVPAVVRIECSRERGECREASISAHDGAVGIPSTNIYPAQFASDAVTYENTDPVCARYSVRIDLKLEKVLAVRTTTGNKLELCKGMEPRIEMQLGDSWDNLEDPMKGHFVPVMRAVVAVVELLG